MSKKFFVFLMALLGGVFLWSNAYAAAPQITNAKYKAAGNSPKVAVFFDQGVQRVGGGGDLTPADFTLGGASSTGATINNVWAVDLNGKGDNGAPSVLGVFQFDSNFLGVMFSEEVDAQTATSSGSYANFLTAAGGDAPGLQDRLLAPELSFAALQTTASTTLGWGVGNSIDIGSIRDLVDNPIAATSTYTILPAIKISEVKAEAASANTQDEFIELYNFGGTVTFSTSTLFLHLRNGAVDTAVPLNLSKNQIPSMGYYLIGNQTGYSGGLSLDASYSSSTDILTANSGVYISASSTPNALVIDLLGMGSSAIKETATTTALAAGKSYERKAQPISATSTMAVGGSEEFKGNFYDSNNNSQDFLLRNTPQPQNSMSPSEFPFGQPGQNDTGAPQVMGSFPGGMPGEMVANNLSYVGFNFNEPMQENTVSLSTVKLYANSAPATNLCSSVSYSNFPTPGNPPGKCVVSSSLAAETHTLKIFGDSTNATSSTAVRDVAGNALNQSGANNGDASGNYVITFTPSSGGSTYTFMAPPVFVMGSLPFPGAVNIPTNIQKVYVKFSSDVATSTLNTTNIRLIKVSDSSVVSLSSVTPSASESRFTSDIAIMNLSGALAANTQYRISVTGVTDTQSRPVDAPPMFTFTTGVGADTSGPLVTGKLPSIASGVPVNAIDIHVMTDDKLDPSTIASTTVKILQGSNEIPGTVDFDPFTGEIMFFANNVFQANTSYTVSVNATTTNPCVKNLSNICLQDNDGTADGAYKF
ncbi:MAG: Metal dependent amidohydrolase, partial [Candidatus Giovannonibacteria bacterium GW2011_GWA2_44_26]